MDYYVVSDLHLGSKYSECTLFMAFLKSLPTDCTLILNGDTVNRKRRYFGNNEQKVIQALVEFSRHAKVIWLGGNHDRTRRPDETGDIEFRPFVSLDGTMITHGHTFDLMMKINRPFVLIFMFSHWFLNLFKAESMHVSAFAKRFTFLYTLLRNHVRSNAISFAQKNGCKTMICGHTHYCEDQVIDGIRYINTGSWIEKPVHYVLIKGNAITLEEFKA